MILRLGSFFQRSIDAEGSEPFGEIRVDVVEQRVPIAIPVVADACIDDDQSLWQAHHPGVHGYRQVFRQAGGGEFRAVCWKEACGGNVGEALGDPDDFSVSNRIMVRVVHRSRECGFE